MAVESEKIYAALCALFAVLLVTGNLIYQKFVYLPILPFYSFELSVGVIFYPLTFLITDIIAEFYGKEKATFCVRISLVISVLVALMIVFMSKLEATEWSKVNNQTFNIVFRAYGVGFISSIIAVFIAQSMDIVIYLWIRKATKGRLLWLRSNGSTAISLFIDTTVVISLLVFFGVLPSQQLLPLIFNSYSFKLLATICSTPLFYGGVYLVKYLQKPAINIS